MEEKQGEEKIILKGSTSKVSCTEQNLRRKKKTKKKDQEEAESKMEVPPIYSGSKLAKLEQALDPTLRDRMEVISAEQYRSIVLKEEKNFYVG